MNYYIFVVADQSKYGKSRSADETYTYLMRKNTWGFGENTSHRNEIKSGDTAVFYQAGGGGQKFLGTVTLASGAYKDSSSKDLFIDPETYKIDLDKVSVWDTPKPIEPLVEKLSFIKEKQYWGTYFQGGCRKITAEDYSIILHTKPPKTILKDSPEIGCWVVRMGRGGKYVNKVIDKKIIAIGWSKIQKLTGFSSPEMLREQVKKDYPDGAAAQSTGQLLRFRSDMKRGDIVLVPVPFERKILVTKVTSDYYYEEDKEFDYAHRRRVEIIKTISRDDCSQQLKFSLGGLLTVFSVRDHADEISALVKGTASVELTKTHSNIYDAVINRLFEMGAREFQDFINQILNVAGFEAAVTEYVGDKGVDIMGNLNAEGLAQVKLKVQVKRVHGSLGIDEVLRTRGSLAPDEHGCVITLATFTKSAIEEAEDETKKPIVLIDGNGLVDLILSHYENLSEDYKRVIGVKPKKLSLEQRFAF